MLIERERGLLLRWRGNSDDKTPSGRWLFTVRAEGVFTSFFMIGSGVMKSANMVSLYESLLVEAERIIGDYTVVEGRL